MNNKIRHIIESVFLALLILLNILEFFGMLPGDVDYLKKIVSWTLLAYLFYKLDMPRILFGEQSSDINLLIVISYLLLAFKKFTTSILLLSGDSVFFSGFFDLVASNAYVIEQFTFIMGGVALISVSFYMAVRCNIQKQSLMGIIHESGKPPVKYSRIIVRGLALFVVLTSFFVMLFDLVIEWLAIAVDSLLVMFAIFFYLFYIIRRHKHYNAGSLIYRIGSFGENFYEKFLEMFHKRKTVFLAVAGVLVLHLITDLGIFIVPAIFNFNEVYFGALDAAKHQAVFTLLVQDLQGSFLNNIAVVLTYLMNVIAIVMLMLIPAYLWYNFVMHKKVRATKTWIALFLSSLAGYLISPVFRISSLFERNFVGVDIQTMGSANAVTAAVTGILVFAAVFLSFRYIKAQLINISVISVNIFVAAYVYFFFISTAKYYIRAIIFLAENSQYFTGLYFLLFFSIIILFYASGLYVLASTTIKEV